MSGKSKKKKKKQNHYFLDFIRIVATLAMIIVVVGVAFLYLKDTVKAKAGDKLIEYTIKSQAKEYGISSQQVDKVLQSIDESDRELIENIVENHLDSDTISKGIDLVKSRDESGIKAFVEEELSEKEIGDLTGLYEKYKERLSMEEMGQIAEEIQNSQTTE